MKTLTLLSILLTVALGLPFEQNEAQVPPQETLQRPLVGDLLPVQGHVVEENPAPQPEVGKELQLSAPGPDNEEQTALQVQEEYAQAPVNEAEEPPVKQDLTEVNNEIEMVDAAPFEEVSLESELDGQDMEGVQADLEPKAEITEEDEEKVPVQELEDHNDIEAKYDFEQPIMKLEPLTDEEMQRDELLKVSETNREYEEPIMYLEPETAEGQFMNENNVPDAAEMAVGEEGPMLDAMGEPLRLSEEYEGTMRLEPPESEAQSQMHGPRSCSGVALDGKCFQFFTNPKKASEAEFFCQTFPGGHLASITSSRVHNEMMNLMRQNGGTRRTWVGGIRFLDTGRFVWLDGSHWGYADWLWGEPNDTAGLEDCIEVLASGKFNDFTCWEPQAFICSYPYQ